MLVVGDNTNAGAGFGRSTCGENADRNALDLFGQQMELLRALAAANETQTQLVVVLVHGRPATFGQGNELLLSVDALLAAWRPGALFDP